MIVSVDLKEDTYIRCITPEGIDAVEIIEINKQMYRFQRDENGYVIPLKLTAGKHSIMATFSVVIFTAELRTTDELMKCIVDSAREEKRIVQRNHSMRNSQRNGNNDCEMTTKEIIPLKCSISMMKFTYPMKGKYCKHDYCIDVYVIAENMKRRNWHCTCKQPMRWNDVLIDEWLIEVIKNSPENACFATVEDGKVLNYLDENKRIIGEKQTIEMIELNPSQMGNKPEIVSIDSYNSNNVNNNMNNLNTVIKNETKTISIEIDSNDKTNTNNSNNLTTTEIICLDESEENENNEENEMKIEPKQIEINTHSNEKEIKGNWGNEMFINLSMNEINQLIEETNQQKRKRMEEEQTNEVHYLESWNRNIPDEIQIDIWKQRGYSDEQIEVIRNGCQFNFNEMYSQPQRSQRKSLQLQILTQNYHLIEKKEEDNQMILENLNDMNNNNNNQQMEIIDDDEVPEYPEAVEVIDFDDDYY